MSESSFLTIHLSMLDLAQVERISSHIRLAAKCQRLRLAVVGRIVDIRIESSLCDHFSRNIFCWLWISCIDLRGSSWSREILANMLDVDLLRVDADRIILEERSVWRSGVRVSYL